MVGWLLGRGERVPIAERDAVRVDVAVIVGFARTAAKFRKESSYGEINEIESVCMVGAEIACAMSRHKGSIHLIILVVEINLAFLWRHAFDPTNFLRVSRAMASSKSSAMSIVIVSFALLFLAGFLLTVGMGVRIERFGAQGGEMVQLAAGRVPTMQDVREDQEERKQVFNEITNMTGYW